MLAILPLLPIALLGGLGALVLLKGGSLVRGGRRVVDEVTGKVEEAKADLSPVAPASGEPGEVEGALNPSQLAIIIDSPTTGELVDQNVLQDTIPVVFRARHDGGVVTVSIQFDVIVEWGTSGTKTFRTTLVEEIGPTVQSFTRNVTAAPGVGGETTATILPSVAGVGGFPGVEFRLD